MKGKTKLTTFIYRDDKFLERNIPKRSWLLEPAIPMPSIGMMYAWRGSGKTYTGLSLSIAIARGEDWMGYKVPIKRPVLYIDGEMPLGDLKERIGALTQGSPTKWLFLLASEDLADEHLSLDFSKKSIQVYLDEALDEISASLGEPFGLIVLDNWTSLMGGIDENDNSALHPVKQWLISLRHRGHSVLLVHHTGKDANQRGASAREDVLDYSFKLSLPKNRTPHTFNFEWDKTRTGIPEPRTFQMLLQHTDKGLLLVRKSSDSVAQGAQNEDAVLQALPARFKEIEEKTGLHPMSITRRLNILFADGKIAKCDDKIWRVTGGSE